MITTESVDGAGEPPLVGHIADAMLEPFRIPAWEHWKRLDCAELWQLVALSFDVEPMWPARVIRFEARSGRAPWAREAFELVPRLPRLLEDIKFRSRLEEAVSWLRSGRMVVATGASSADFGAAFVAPAVFVACAASRDWGLPDDLRRWADMSVDAGRVHATATSMRPEASPAERGRKGSDKKHLAGTKLKVWALRQKIPPGHAKTLKARGDYLGRRVHSDPVAKGLFEQMGEPDNLSRMFSTLLSDTSTVEGRSKFIDLARARGVDVTALERC